ncbi:MAG: hypothetical protein ACHP78_15425 [Terriglobales bacterium]
MTIQSLPFRTRILRARKSGPAARRAGNESGIALLTTLLLLILVSILGLTMAVTTNSDMMINSYYGSYRGSFYAADSGLNIARAQLVNNIVGQVTMTPCTGWVTGSPASGCTNPPLSLATGTSSPGYIAMTNLTTTYGSFTSLNAGQAANSWMGKFVIANNGNCANSATLAAGYPTTTQNAQGQNNSYTYVYTYTLCSVGRAQALQQVATQEKGSVTVNILAQTSTSQQATVSFAAFGGYINNFSQCQGPLAYGTSTGPFFTNGQWNFGTGGSYIFTDPVGQHATTADFIFGGGGTSCGGVSGCDCKNAATDSSGGQTIAPTFQSGFNRNQALVALPTNDFGQQWAVLDGKGCGEGGSTCGVSAPPAPTNANFHSYLKNVSQNTYPSGGAASGVYLAYCTIDCVTYPPPVSGINSPNKVLGGGIYVAGNAGIQLSLGTDTFSNPTQIYTITQGGTTTTVTLNITANTTTVVSGGTTLNLAGVPTNLSGATPQEAAMVYVNGTITGLSGPGQGQASLQDYYATTIAANGSINVTGDLIYKHEPVTLNTSDTLVANNDFNQVLGLFTANGDIVESSSYGNQNLEIDASMAAINSSCTASSSSSICGFATSGSINTLTIVGGRIESNAHGVSLNAVNTYFDRRFTSRAGFAPPWFPSTTLPQQDITNAQAPLVTPSQPQRLTWVTYPQ